MKSEVLNALTKHVRVLTSAQAARGWFQFDGRAARRTLTDLKRGGFVRSVGMSLFADPEVKEPLFIWSGLIEGKEPEFNQLAYRLSVRQPPMKRGTIWTATPKAFVDTRRSRSVRRTDWEHDIAVAAIWMNSREMLQASGDDWILEDDLGMADDFPDVEKPDAMIRRSDGRIILIEYCGRYSAETLRRKHDSWSSQHYWLF